MVVVGKPAPPTDTAMLKGMQRKLRERAERRNPPFVLLPQRAPANCSRLCSLLAKSTPTLSMPPTLPALGTGYSSNWSVASTMVHITGAGTARVRASGIRAGTPPLYGASAYVCSALVLCTTDKIPLVAMGPSYLFACIANEVERCGNRYGTSWKNMMWNPYVRPWFFSHLEPAFCRDYITSYFQLLYPDAALPGDMVAVCNELQCEWISAQQAVAVNVSPMHTLQCCPFSSRVVMRTTGRPLFVHQLAMQLVKSKPGSSLMDVWDPCVTPEHAVQRNQCGAKQLLFA